MTAETSGPAADAPVLLAATGITKSFGGARALEDVSIDVRAGEIHALLGENGAGKSTLVRIIAGVATADQGTITGADDVAMVFQELSVIGQMSVLDNLMLGRPNQSALTNPKRDWARVQDALRAAGLEGTHPDTPVEALSLAQRQLLEIARALVSDARVLILDEPTATLSEGEIARIHTVVRSLTADGRAVVYITHRLGEVLELATTITIMRNGRVVAHGDKDEFTMESIITNMLGAEPEVVATDEAPAELEHAVTLSVSDLGSAKHFADVSLTARGGEVVALFGQIGSGADDVVRAIAGLDRSDTGAIRLDDRQLGTGRRASQRAGVAYVSPDRVVEGVFLDATVTRNVSSGALADVSRFGVLDKRRELRLVQEMSSRVAFDQSRVSAGVGTLSGGNQQKVAIARALATRPRVLVLNEPTRGVDVGARAEIYRAIRALARTGVVVIVYSSDVTELRELTDRVITMFRGHVVGTHTTADVQDSALLAEILHGSAA